MKNIIFLAIAFLSVLFLASCEEEEPKEVVYIFSDGIILESAVNDFLGSETFGIEHQAAIVSNIVNESIDNPQETYNFSEQAEFFGSYGSYDYSYSYMANNLSDTIEVKLDAKGEYETFYVSSNDLVNSDWDIGGVDMNNDFFNCKGISTRDGNQFSKIYEDYFDSELKFVIENLKINKITKTIKSGKVTFEFEGRSSYGEVFTSSGTIEYSDYQKVITHNEYVKKSSRQHHLS